MPQEHRQILASPIDVLIANDGGIARVTVSKSEPEWSINFKKGLLSLFQKKIDESFSMELVQNMVSTINHINQNFRKTYVNNFFTS